MIVHERTIYRWHQTLGNRLVTYPSIAVETLGLSHLFVFANDQIEAWTSFPYAVETALVSADCTTRLLYVHAVVPDDHREAVTSLLRSRCGCQFVWGNTGWEHLGLCRGEVLPSRFEAPRSGAALRVCPLVVPVVFEHWGRQHSLQSLWNAIHQRLGDGVASYVGRRHYTTNGKRHVRQAYRALMQDGAFRQHIVRYQPLTDGALRVLVVASWTEEVLRSFVQRAQAHIALLVLHPTATGWLLRIVGDPHMLDLVMDAQPDGVYFVREETSARFRYEELFDPAHRSWVDPSITLEAIARGKA